MHHAGPLHKVKKLGATNVQVGQPHASLQVNDLLGELGEPDLALVSDLGCPRQDGQLRPLTGDDQWKKRSQDGRVLRKEEGQWLHHGLTEDQQGAGKSIKGCLSSDPQGEELQHVRGDNLSI